VPCRACVGSGGRNDPLFSLPLTKASESLALPGQKGKGRASKSQVPGSLSAATSPSSPVKQIFASTQFIDTLLVLYSTLLLPVAQPDPTLYSRLYFSIFFLPLACSLISLRYNRLHPPKLLSTLIDLIFRRLSPRSVYFLRLTSLRVLYYHLRPNLKYDTRSRPEPLDGP